MQRIHKENKDMKKQNEVKQLVSREAEQNATSKKWRMVEKFSDGSMRRLTGAFKTKEEAEASVAPIVDVAEPELVVDAGTLNRRRRTQLKAEKKARKAEPTVQKAEATVEPELGNPQGITLVSGTTGKVIQEVKETEVKEVHAKKLVKAKGKALAAELKTTPKKDKAKVKAAAAAQGTLTLRLYAKGEFYFGKKQAELLNGQPYLLVAVNGKKVTLTPTKSKKDAQEIKFSHGNPVVRVSKLLAETGWNKTTQDLAITMDGSVICVEVR
jgi:hypothetical protein